MTGFAVACGHEVTADAASDILRAGGTAVDAAIAGALAAMVAEPVLAGLLGGGFLMVREPGERTHVLDFFVQTPARKLPEGHVDQREILAEFGTTTQAFHIGSGTIAVPGVAPGLTEAHARFGRVPFRDLAVPAVAAAREGAEVTPYQAELGRIVGAILGASPEAEALFFDDGAPLNEGKIYRNPELADVLEVFAAEGARFVTEGEVAQALLSLTDQGGQVTAEDLRTYEPVWRSALNYQRGGAQIAVNPPPSLGGVLAGFSLDLLDQGPDPVDLALAFQTVIAARQDIRLDQSPAEGATRLQSEDAIRHYRAMVARNGAALRGTTHVSVIDSDGMGAALTLSNGEGCGLIVPGTGIMPNNMLGEDDLMPDGPGSWKPGQRLSSMMAPMAVNWPDGRFAMLGSGGSNRIRTALAQVLIGLIDCDQRLEPAITAPRLHVEAGDPLTLDFEDIAGEETRERLLEHWPEARAWPDRSMFFGGVHGTMRSAAGDLDAAGDPRRAGVARVS